MKQLTASQQITDEVTSWAGVTAGPGERGSSHPRSGDGNRPPSWRQVLHTGFP